MSLAHPKSDEDAVKLIDTKDGKLLVLDFYADWCGPCVRFAPTFEKLAKENTGVKFGKVDCTNRGTMTNAKGKCNLGCYPTIAFFKDGKFLGKVEGGVEQQINDNIAKWK